MKDLKKELGPGLLAIYSGNSAFERRISDVCGDEIPPPSRPKRGQHLISVPLYLAPKLALYLAMRERHMAKTELAARLGVSETVVRRTKPEKIQAALAALGKRIVVTFEDAA